MKIRIIIVLTLLFLIIVILLKKVISDNSKQRFDLCKTENGYNIDIKVENVNYCLEFYPNGNIKKLSQKDTGSAIGLQQSFYKNGRLFFSTAIDNNKLPIGDQVLFNTDGTIQQVERTINIAGEISMLEKIRFLKTGISDNSSYFFTFNLFESETDNIVKHFLKITYHCKSNILPINIRFGNYNKNWSLNDSTNMTIVEMVNNSCVLDYDEFRKYGDTLRGELQGITPPDTFYTPVEFVW